MLFYFQVLFFKDIFFISKRCTISPVVYTVIAPQASVSAEVPVCQVLGRGCQIVYSLMKPTYYEWTQQTTEKNGEARMEKVAMGTDVCLQASSKCN